MSKQICIIVGMGAGIALAVARRFGQENFYIAMVGRRAEALDQFEQALGAEGIEARGFVGDASDETSLRAALQEISGSLCAADALIYNAYGATEGIPSELSLADARRDLEANVLSPLLCAQTVLPEMRRRGRGSLIFTGGGIVFEPYPNAVSLGIGKSALRYLAFSLFKELQATGIHAATVTVAGAVGGSSELAPERIAEEFWRLHAQEPGGFEREIVVRPSSGSTMSKGAAQP